MQLSADGTKNAVALTWTIEASDWDWKDCLEIAKNSKDGVKSVRVTQAPAAPEDITFRVSAADYGEIGTYTVTVGAPIDFAATQPAPPQFISQRGTSTVRLYLKGAGAIKSVPETCMTTIADSTNQDMQIRISSAEIDKVEKSEMGLDLTVTIITGFVGGQWRPDNDKNPAYNKGRLLDISINTKGFTLKTREEGNPGWYLPDKLRLSSMGVHVLIPVFTKVELTSVGTETYDFKIYTENMPWENANIFAAFAPKGKASYEVDGAGIKAQVTREGNGVYLASFDKTNFEPGEEYSVWCRFGADWVGSGNGDYRFG